MITWEGYHIKIKIMSHSCRIQYLFNLTQNKRKHKLTTHPLNSKCMRKSFFLFVNLNRFLWVIVFYLILWIYSSPSILSQVLYKVLKNQYCYSSHWSYHYNFSIACLWFNAFLTSCSGWLMRLPCNWWVRRIDNRHLRSLDQWVQAWMAAIHEKFQY